MPSNAPLAPSATSRTSLSLPTHIITKSWPVGGLLRRRGFLAAVLRDPFVGLGGVAVVNGDLVAALVLEMPGHRIAHHAETEKCHFRHRCPSCALSRRVLI